MMIGEDNSLMIGVTEVCPKTINCKHKKQNWVLDNTSVLKI